MIEKILNDVIQKKGHQISFVLGQNVLIKIGIDWTPLGDESFKISEWEDLKDICLQSSEKIQLETKGFVSGLYVSNQHSWKISFTERKDCFRAFMCLADAHPKAQCQIQNPLFWDLLKKDRGIFIFAGPRRGGKSHLISEILEKKQSEKIDLIGIHASESEFQWPQMGNIIQLGSDTMDWDLNHLIYDGLENIVIDFNSIKKWEKWIELAEQGRVLFITLTAENIQTLLQQIFEKLTPGLMYRFLNLLNGVVVQKLVHDPLVPIYELLLLKQSDKSQFNQMGQLYRNDGYINIKMLSQENYQSFNQSIIQNLVRRQIDVKTAFASSDHPEELDETLKKMGL